MNEIQPLKTCFTCKYRWHVYTGNKQRVLIHYCLYDLPQLKQVTEDSTCKNWETVYDEGIIGSKGGVM